MDTKTVQMEAEANSPGSGAPPGGIADFYKMQVESLQKELDREKAKREAAEDKADKYKEESHDLQVKLNTKDRETELEKAAAASQSDGLNGLMGDTPEEKKATVKEVLGGFRDLVASVTGKGQQQQLAATPKEEPEMEEDSQLSQEAQSILSKIAAEVVPNMDTHQLAKYYKVGLNPELVDKVYNNAQKQQT
jgi:hypothetical protein